ncbi:C1 family peptidase [uncultured Methanobrevibacter sp.]|uniref:C1 family peptidase n=1 Tax=uncultured Methanobrevibacter sp. TaxID=253161 RepID=UPI0025D88C66|nr:C1 family peptidase [uncultured Methanobrevibacter sp.]
MIGEWVDEGALYLDAGEFNITNSYIANNGIKAIHARDTILNVSNTIFDNNTQAIYGVFSEFELNNITLGNDTLFLNGTDYQTIMQGPGTPYTLINNTINVETLPSRFDSRDWAWVSPVKEQGNMGACWTFGTAGAVESAFLKATGKKFIFSENNIQNTMLQYSDVGIMGVSEGGAAVFGAQYLVSWLGIFPDKYDTYDEIGKISPSLILNENIHIQDILFVMPPENVNNTDHIKRAIMQCGSLMVGYHADPNEPAYNEKTGAQYQNETMPNHGVSVVGWDDNYSKDNFLMTPPGDGAWIIKNSWGVNNGDGGFNYISYYDPSFSYNSVSFGIILENTEEYNTNYQTDLGGFFRLNESDEDFSYKITYPAIGNELISAVGTYFHEKGENYTLEIYVNDELKHVQNGTAPFFGFHTVKLTDEIQIKSGDNFTAVMTKKSVPLLSYFCKNTPTS